MIESKPDLSKFSDAELKNEVAKRFWKKMEAKKKEKLEKESKP